ncbi:MAG: hypothetical protein ACI4X9_05540 [Kiritimatiellia bacterium]
MSGKRHNPRIPVAIQGGIRAQQLRGTQARSWWFRRWIDSVEEFGMGARTGRGKNYSIQGQVGDLQQTTGKVTARVQGAESTPYEVSIVAPRLLPRQRDEFLSFFREHPIYLARLLVQDMPKEVEAAFLAATGRSLFPGVRRKEGDWATESWAMRYHKEPRTIFELHCNCRDWARPCKHLAAIFFLVGELIANDPFCLLVLQGFTWEDFDLAPPPEVMPGFDGLLSADGGRAPLSDEVTAEMGSWWGNRLARLTDNGPRPVQSGSAMPLMERIAAPPLWRGNEKFLEVMGKVYAAARLKATPLYDGTPVSFYPSQVVPGARTSTNPRPPKRLSVMVY